MVERIAPPPTETQAPAMVTFQEFLKLFEGQYAEWLMGKVEVYVSNNYNHNDILSFFDTVLRLFLGITKLGKLGLAGFPMYLGDDHPSRQPDLMIILTDHLDRLTPNYLNGPADICVEIVSPESAERDYGAKFVEYEAAGVREYWLIDPQRQRAEFHHLTADGVYHRLPLDGMGRLVSNLLPGFVLDPAI
ncbi:MAG: Uma2 family endonuclease, partial [Anaerolineae bacterium]